MLVSGEKMAATSCTELRKSIHLYNHDAELTADFISNSSMISIARIAALSIAFGALAFGQRGGAGPQLVSLKQTPLPQPTNISAYVKDQSALVVLGKAFFW